MKTELPADAPQPSTEALNELIALFNAGQPEVVEGRARSLVDTYPDSGFAWLILGVALEAQQKDAVAPLQAAARLLPGDAEAQCNLGVALDRAGRREEAVAAYRSAVTLNPGFANAHCYMGNTLKELARYEEAIDCYLKTLAVEPAHYKANLVLKSLYFLLMRIKDAEALCRKTLAAKPDFAEMRHELAISLAYLSDYEDVVTESDLAFAFKPDQPLMWEQRLYTFSYHPDLSAETIFKEFVKWGDQFPEPATDFSWHDRSPHRRLRIGYVSPDFRKHTSRFYFWPLFTNHNREEFELFAYSNVETEVAWTQLFKGQFEHWRDIRPLSDAAAADLIRADGIDILVDLCNHMQDDRLGVFTLKPAPIQATWLGAAWTTGLKAVDYVLFDPHVAPEGTLTRETIVRLPHSFMVFRPKEQASDLVPPPCLTNGYPTFGYTGRTERLNHRTFRVWGELLKRLPTARLILDFGPFADPHTQAHYRTFLARHGVDLARVTMRKSANIFDGLNDIDILLDSFPHSGGTMLLDAFWMGVPAITLAGRPPVGRLGVGMLMNLGLPDWIATSEDDYIERACHHASAPEHLRDLRLGMRERIRNSPLMDGPGFARAVESAYRDMFDRWVDGIHGQGGKA